MRKLLLIPFLALLVAAAPAAASQSKLLQIRMHDPGCHSFYLDRIIASTRRRWSGADQ